MKVSEELLNVIVTDGFSTVSFGHTHFPDILLYAFLFLPSSLIIYFLVCFVVGGGDGPPGLN